MRTLLSSLLLSTAAASTAVAGSVTTEFVEPAAIIAPASITDWAGFYAGGVASMFSGEQAYTNDFDVTIYPFEDSPMYGVFGGYNHQMGSFVLGGEVAYQAGEFTDVQYPDDKIENMLDVKLRAGYALGKALVYASGGYSAGLYNQGSSGGWLMDTTGYNVGAGVDYRITDSFFAGLEYVYRDVGGQFNPSDSDNTVEFEIEAIQLRLGVQF